MERLIRCSLFSFKVLKIRTTFSNFSKNWRENMDVNVDTPKRMIERTEREEERERKVEGEI